MRNCLKMYVENILGSQLPLPCASRCEKYHCVETGPEKRKVPDLAAADTAEAKGEQLY